MTLWIPILFILWSFPPFTIEQAIAAPTRSLSLLYDSHHLAASGAGQQCASLNFASGSNTLGIQETAESNLKYSPQLQECRHRVRFFQPMRIIQRSRTEFPGLSNPHDAGFLPACTPGTPFKVRSVPHSFAADFPPNSHQDLRSNQTLRMQSSRVIALRSDDAKRSHFSASPFRRI